MKRLGYVLAGIAFVLAGCVPLYAQNGCANSPENPTAVLAMIGSAGIFVSHVRARVRSRRSAGKK